MDTVNVKVTAYGYEGLDLPPEYCRYQDSGCELATTHLGYKSSCLDCPFTQCIYDEPGGRQHHAKRLRDQEIARMFATEKKGIKELALMFGISQRTVQRALKRNKNGFTPKIKISRDANE